ncbi:hypothetical protein HVA01_33490 [Halovibrio variabilis]|uniref:Uncharacterized protein n=1 Tax=Halovibrio variabilis TaxID=31910 RepID=A0A511UW77_9GAMM|nr:hypothetical protein HVA01_33490 [Halovibrio variabilis]
MAGLGLLNGIHGKGANGIGLLKTGWHGVLLAENRNNKGAIVADFLCGGKCSRSGSAKF